MYGETDAMIETLAEQEGLKASYIRAFAGSSAPLHQSVLAFTGPDRAFVTCDPGYEAGERAAQAIKAPIKRVPLLKDKKFAHDVRGMAAVSNAGLIYVCNPNNPTGTVYTREELEMLAGFCRDHGLFLISDEVYREFVYDGRHAVSALELKNADDFVIVVDSLSKRYSACGIRLGALVTRNREIYDACLRMAQGRLSPPGIAQFIAVGAESLGDDYTRDVVTEYQRRRDVLFEGLTSIPGVFLQKPEGAFYCIARLPVSDAERFAAWLLSDFSHDGATVMIAPAAGFYASPLGTSEVRIAYVLKEEDLRRSIDVLRVALLRSSF